MRRVLSKLLEIYALGSLQIIYNLKFKIVLKEVKWWKVCEKWTQESVLYIISQDWLSLK